MANVNQLTTVDALEEINVDPGAGNQHPELSVRLGYHFGWAGSGGLTGRSSTGFPQMVAYGQIFEEGFNIAAAASTDSAAAGFVSGAAYLPARSRVEAVPGRVVVASIPTATTISIGDATTAGRFDSGISSALNTTWTGQGAMQGSVTTNAAGPVQAANAKVRITPNSTPASNAGWVGIQVFAYIFVPPTQ